MKGRDPVEALGCGGLVIMAVVVALLSLVLYAAGVRVTFPWDVK